MRSATIAILVLAAAGLVYLIYRARTSPPQSGGLVGTAQTIFGSAGGLIQGAGGLAQTALGTVGAVSNTATGVTTGIARGLVSGTRDVVSDAMPWNW